MYNKENRKDKQSVYEKSYQLRSKIMVKSFYNLEGNSDPNKRASSATSASKPVTNTLEMAEALLTGEFTLEMGRDYGCAGRGLFDAFAHTIGSHVDDVDAAFFVWKKCVQCASGNDKSNVLAYSYDVKSDTCGKLND